MKASTFLAAVCLITAGSSLFTSCVQKNYYNTSPNNNQGNTTTGTTAYTFDEEFNGADNYGWNFTDATDSAYASITNGSYQYVNYGKTLSNTSVVNTGNNVQDNFTVKTSIKSNNVMGLVFGASSTDNGYAFFVDTAGNYSLYKEGTGTVASQVVIPFTQDTLYAVKNAYNTLEVDQTSGNWTGYINGTQVFQMAARPVSGSSFGFKVLPGTVGYADYLIVKNY